MRVYRGSDGFVYTGCSLFYCLFGRHQLRAQANRRATVFRGSVGIDASGTVAIEDKGGDVAEYRRFFIAGRSNGICGGVCKTSGYQTMAEPRFYLRRPASMAGDGPVCGICDHRRGGAKAFCDGICRGSGDFVCALEFLVQYAAWREEKNLWTLKKCRKWGRGFSVLFSMQNELF